ncbi:MAG TPA: ABC transporter substrate-binding protein [Clostridiales bacterium]|nr:ABC transporter substrate-binding protein [Clostridiales bacterium]
MKKKITRWVCTVMAGCMLIGLLAGCTSGSSPKETGTPDANSDNSTATDKAVTSITIGTSDAWDTLTPFRTTQSQMSSMVRYIYDRLAYQTADNRYIPQVAKSWEVEDDGVTWNVEIFDYVADSEGNHITASDIVWMLEESMAQGLKPCYNKIASVEQTGDYSFKVVMKQDIVNSFELVLVSTYVVSQKAYEASTDDFAAKTISTSPYLVTDFVSGSHITFKKRDDYWQKEELIDKAQANNLETITYKIIKEASQQQVALETGTVDAFENISATVVPAFEGNASYETVQFPSSNGIQLFYSGDESRVIAKDEDLCRAISYAIDAEGLVAGVYNGYAKVMHDAAVESVVGYLEKWNDEEYFPYDVDKAKEYLAKSNYKGEELELLCMSDSTSQRIAQMIQNYLLAVDIKLKLNIVDAALFSASRFDGAQYDMIIINAGAGSLPAFWSNRFDSTAYEKGDGTARNDEVLTAMLYSTWTNEGFTEENIDAVRRYIIDHAYAYGMCLPTSCSIYAKTLSIQEIVSLPAGTLDFAACVYQ